MVATAGGAQWAALAAVDSAERERRMREHLDSVLALEAGERDQALEEMVVAEYALDDTQLRPFTASRLRVWAAIGKTDLETAKHLGRGYDAVFDRLGAGPAMRRASMVQSVARQDLTPEEVETLFEVIPSMLRQVPKARVATATVEKAVTRPWWKVWARGTA